MRWRVRVGRGPPQTDPFEAVPGAQSLVDVRGASRDTSAHELEPQRVCAQAGKARRLTCSTLSASPDPIPSRPLFIRKAACAPC